MGYDMNTTGENGYEPIVERLRSGLNDGEEPLRFITIKYKTDRIKSKTHLFYPKHDEK
jgi:hypothetical protein